MRATCTAVSRSSWRDHQNNRRVWTLETTHSNAKLETRKYLIRKISGGVFVEVRLRITFLWDYLKRIVIPICIHTGRFHSISNSVQEMYTLQVELLPFCTKHYKLLTINTSPSKLLSLLFSVWTISKAAGMRTLHVGGPLLFLGFRAYTALLICWNRIITVTFIS